MTTQTFAIRGETEHDAPAITEATSAAFEFTEISRHTKECIVEALRFEVRQQE